MNACFTHSPPVPPHDVESILRIIIDVNNLHCNALLYPLYLRARDALIFVSSGQLSDDSAMKGINRPKKNEFQYSYLALLMSIEAIGFENYKTELQQ